MRHYTFLILSLSTIAGLVFTGNAQTIDPTWDDVNYANNDGNIRHNLDIYLPETGSGPFPVVVYIHGGGWQSGNKKNVGPVSPIVEEGYALVSINYRLSAEAFYPEQINDCKAAIRWIRANEETYQLDAERIGVIGSSAGAHLAELLGTSGDITTYTVGSVTMDIEGDIGGNLNFSSRVQAVSDWFGPTDFLRMNDFPGDIDHDAPTSPESKLIGGPIQENPDKCALADPITYASEDDSPFLIVHGTADMTVPYNQSELLYQALQPIFDPIGTEITLRPVEGAGHGFGGTMTTETYTLMIEFFDRTIKNVTTIGDDEFPNVKMKNQLKYFIHTFSSRMDISYQLNSSANVRLEIYNSKGECESILDNTYRQAGIYTIHWNTSVYSSGTYFCTFTAGDYRISDKILLLK